MRAHKNYALVPNVRDHGVDAPSRSTLAAYAAPNPHVWTFLPAEHRNVILSDFARFGGRWPKYFLTDMLNGAPVPPAVQEQADKRRREFLALPAARRDAWVGPFPGPGT